MKIGSQKTLPSQSGSFPVARSSILDPVWLQRRPHDLAASRQPSRGSIDLVRRQSLLGAAKNHFGSLPSRHTPRVSRGSLVAKLRAADTLRSSIDWQAQPVRFCDRDAAGLVVLRVRRECNPNPNCDRPEPTPIPAARFGPHRCRKERACQASFPLGTKFCTSRRRQGPKSLISEPHGSGAQVAPALACGLCDSNTKERLAFNVHSAFSGCSFAGKISSSHEPTNSLIATLVSRLTTTRPPV